ncbi:MAG: hypothetical protein KDK45_19825 [Leptospiraceae bacterium]|nr:hypothetical protein [Leptospiraceae bacterium]
MIPILVYISFFAYTYFILSQHPETNPPPSVFKLLDFPFLGLLKSLSMDLSSNPKIIVKQLSKLPIPIYFILLIFNIYNITSIQRFILFLPLLAIIGLAAISEKDYWDSFDNISRMFTLTGPIIILFKNKMENYKDFYVLHAGALIYLLVLIRFIAIKQGMTFFLSNIHLH